jgi:hypothetical protein
LKQGESDEQAMGSLIIFSPYCLRIVKKPFSNRPQTLPMMQRFQYGQNNEVLSASENNRVYPLTAIL